MTDNILRIAFKGKTEITARPLYQYDYGQVLKFIDINLPLSYEVHFSNHLNNSAITVLGNADGVAIPDALLQTGLTIHSWIYLHTSSDDGETEYKVTIPVTKRACPSNVTPSQVQQDIIEQTIAALESNVRNVQTIASNVTTSVLQAQVYCNSANSYANSASAYASDAWGAVDAINGAIERYLEIGTVLPVVSSADDGKFLRVVDGEWKAMTISYASGVEF